MTRRLKTFERDLGKRELGISLVEPPLLEQRAPQHELRVTDLVQAVLAATQQRQRVTRLLLGGRELPPAELDLCERGHGSRRLVVPTQVDQHFESVLQVRNRLVGL